MPSRGRTPKSPAAASMKATANWCCAPSAAFPIPSQFNDLVVATIGNTPVRIRDIGYAEDGHKEQRTFARYDGKSGRRSRGAAPVRREHDRSHQQRQGAPGPRHASCCRPGVTLDVVQDQSRYIEAAFHEVQLHLILGAFSRRWSCLLFMRNWRATVIAAVAIPASIIATFGAMYWLNFTLNNITMLALVLMVGCRHRRRHRGAREYLPLHRRKEDAADAGGRSTPPATSAWP